MRLISDEALDLISGGNSSSSSWGDMFGGADGFAGGGGGGGGGYDYGGGGGYDYGGGSIDIPTVTIVGSLPYDYGGVGGGGGATGTSAGSMVVSTPVSQPEPPPCTGVHSSPPPIIVPAGVDLNKLRDTMASVGEQIKGMNSDIEHGAVVVRDANGALRVGEIAHGTASEVPIPIDLRAGEVIVAYIHSHPVMDGVDQRMPSRDDFDNAHNLRIKTYADTALLTYILDVKSGDVFEYGANAPRGTNKPGANITDDVVAC